MEYVAPDDFVPPEDASNGYGGGSGGKDRAAMDDDPYDRIVRGSLKLIEKQKVRGRHCDTISSQQKMAGKQGEDDSDDDVDDVLVLALPFVLRMKKT